MQITGSYRIDIPRIDEALNKKLAFDIIKREFINMRGAKCALYAVSGLIKDTVLTDSIEFFIRFDGDNQREIAAIPFIETEVVYDVDTVKNSVLKGGTAIIRDGCYSAIVLYARSYPLRGIEEPENDKVLRGPRDGFGESIVINTSLIRRRIRDSSLCTEKFTVGSTTQTDVVLCYLDGVADKEFLNKLRDKLKSVDTKSLDMGAESIAELLIKKRWYNPFPKIRYTERPDTACAHLTEGSILLICDNYPSVMILPTSIIDFLQETDDFYFPPLVGTYLRTVRCTIILLTLYLLPIWYILQSNTETAPSFLRFLIIDNQAALPLLAQVFIAEIAIDGLKLASLNTPSMLGNSLSVVAGLILSDFAITAGWFEPALIVYVAITAIGNFTQVSYELGYALKFMRLIMLLSVAIIGAWGLVISTMLMFILIASNKGVGGRSYLYPLIPLDVGAMKRQIWRARKK